MDDDDGDNDDDDDDDDDGDDDDDDGDNISSLLSELFQCEHYLYNSRFSCSCVPPGPQYSISLQNINVYKMLTCCRPGNVFII